MFDKSVSAMSLQETLEKARSEGWTDEQVVERLVNCLAGHGADGSFGPQETSGHGPTNFF